MTRGDILLASFPNASDNEAKDRPVLVVQSDHYNQRLKNTLVAGITSNLARQSDPAHFLIDVTTIEGAGSGLRRTSLVSCLNLAVVARQKLGPRLGRLTEQQMLQVDQCLRAAMGIG